MAVHRLRAGAERVRTATGLEPGWSRTGAEQFGGLLHADLLPVPQDEHRTVAEGELGEGSEQGDPERDVAVRPGQIRQFTGRQAGGTVAVARACGGAYEEFAVPRTAFPSVPHPAVTPAFRPPRPPLPSSPTTRSTRCGVADPAEILRSGARITTDGVPLRTGRSGRAVRSKSGAGITGTRPREQGYGNVRASVRRE